MKLPQKLAMLFVPVLLAGCGYGYVYYASDDCRYPFTVEPAVVVEFVDAFNGRALSVDAAGELDDGRSRETLSIFRRGNAAGTVLSLAGGFGRTGLFSVSGVVQASPGAADQPWSFAAVRVRGDACGPFTVRLAVVIE